MTLDELRNLSRSMAGLDRPLDQEALHAHLRTLGMDPGNIYQELEMSSRFVDTHRDVSHSNQGLSLHSHSFCEILYCRNTCQVEYLMGPHRYRLQKGDVVIVPPGVSHRPILPERPTEPYERDVLWISSEFMDHIAGLFPDAIMTQRDQSSPMRTAGTRWEFLGDLFRGGVLEAEQKRPGWELAVIGNTLSIFSHMKRALLERSARTMKAEKPELLDKLMAYIEANYHQKLTLGLLAARFYVSESTVSHLFKQKLGVSVYRYVTQRRLIAAKSRIESGEPMEAVGMAVGFQDYSTFYRAFRQEFGISPRQYRELHSHPLP